MHFSGLFSFEISMSQLGQRKIICSLLDKLITGAKFPPAPGERVTTESHIFATEPGQANFAPHSGQNLAKSGSLARHSGHSICLPPNLSNPNEKNVF